MRDFLNSQIAARQDKLREIDRQKLTVESELRAYLDALMHLGSHEASDEKLNGAACKQGDRVSPIPTEMTPSWRKILCAVSELGRTFGAADILTIGEQVGEPTKMTNVRSQLYQWEKKHIIARVRKGKYRLAQKGIETIKKSEGPDESTSEPS